MSFSYALRLAILKELILTNYLAASYEVSTACNFYCQHNWHPKKQSTTEPQRTQRGSKTQVFGFTLVQKKLWFTSVFSVSLWCQALKFGSIQIFTIFSRDQNL
jgi:hypothetical protein